MTTSINPLSYLGVQAKNPPDIIKAARAPTANDRRHPIGTLWISNTLNSVWELSSIAAGVATWTALGSGTTGAIVTETADAGGALSPVGGDMIIAGTAAQGISTSGAGHTITITAANATTSQKGVNTIATASETRIGTDSTKTVTSADVSSLKAYTDMTLRASPILETALTTGGVPTGATGDVNLMYMQEGVTMQEFIMGAGETIIAPRMNADGLLISLDLTDNEGAEYNFGALTNAKHAAVIGTTAAFFVEASFKVADVTGCDPLWLGFRQIEANNGTYTAYNEYAMIGLLASAGAAIRLETRLNGGVATSTNTTNAWVDGATHTLRINVSAAGVVTYLVDGVAPAVTAAFTFTAARNVMPCIHFLHATVAPGAINLVTFKCGLQ